MLGKHILIMASERWKHSKTTVYNIGFHLIWCPKFRRRVLECDIENRLRELLLEKADEIGITIEKMEIMPDHVHLFVKSSLDCSTIKGLYFQKIKTRIFRTDNKIAYSLDPKLLL